jgi:competence protein ComEC
MWKSWLRSHARAPDPPGSRLLAASIGVLAAVAAGNFFPPAPWSCWPLLGLGVASACLGLTTATGRRGWWVACGVLLGLAACARAPRAPRGGDARAVPVRFETLTRDGWSRGQRGWRTRATAIQVEWRGRPLRIPGEIEMDFAGTAGEAMLPEPGREWRGAGELVYDPELPLAAPRLRVKTLLLVSPGPERSVVDSIRGAGVRLLRHAAGVDPERLRAASLAAAVVLGRREGLQDSEVASLRRSGLAHLLAVSGLHVAAVGLLVWWLLRLLGVGIRARRWALAGALAAFALLAGGNVPVRRAAGAAIAYLLARQLGRPLQPLPAVWAIVGGLALLDPPAVLQPGFQLSAAVTLALVRWTQPLAAALRLPLRVAQALAVALIAQGASSPIIGQHFSALPLLGVAANLAAAPLALLLVAASMLALLCAALSGWVGGIALEAVAASRHLLDAISGAGGVASVAFPPAPAVVVAALVTLGCVALTRVRQAARAAALVVAATVAWVAWPGGGARDPAELRALAVREGMALLLRSGPSSVLVDTGLAPSGAWRELARERVRRLDAIVLTHPDADHIGGAAVLLERMRVGRLAYPRAFGDRPEIVPLRRLARLCGIAEFPLQRGQVFTIGPGRWEVCWPPATMAGVDNDASLVARVSLQGARLLVTGDIEARGEAALLGSHADLHAEVLQLPHHGSRTSSTPGFLAAVRPLIALAATGTRPRFAYPAPEVVRRVAGLPAVPTVQAGGEAIVSWGRDGRLVVGGEPRVFVPCQARTRER